MTNLSEKELELRMALARGECVTNEQGEIYKWDEKLIFRHWWAEMWVMVDPVEEQPNFGPNSKVVPDPSAEKEKERCPVCGFSMPSSGCYSCDSKPSLTYDEALKAIYKTKNIVRVSLPYRVFDIGYFWGDIEKHFWFDLAERHGYRMEVIEE